MDLQDIRCGAEPPRDVFVETLCLIRNARLLHDLRDLIENCSRTSYCPDVRPINEKRLNVH
jgi:hypothetical protein